MIGAQTTEAKCVQYELELEIKAACQQVWQALIEETSAWWLPDFHMVGEDSVVEFDTKAGGRGLVEYKSDGSFLQWYSVVGYMPEQFRVYLVGYFAPDYGGPSTSNLRLSVERRGEGSVLTVVDAHYGKVSGDYIRSLQSGWQQLFSDGLRQFVER